MRPLAYELLRETEAISRILSNVKNGDYIGFFLDSKKSHIRISGLLDNPESVMPLDSILGAKATLFYVDPRPSRTSESSYNSAVDAFSSALLDANLTAFRTEPPCLLLLESRGGRFYAVDYLRLDEYGICLWYSKVEQFLMEHLGEGRRPIRDHNPPSDFRRLRAYGKEVTVEALKAGISALVSGLVASR